MEILLHLLTWRKWKCFFRETYGKTAIYDSSKNRPKKGRSQGFLSSGGWKYFPTQIETFLALSNNFNSHSPATQKRVPSPQAVYSCDIFL